ncbi:hypothetical protein [Methylococcus sp. EFPC2]|uniref:hypothetical protein n=1 Tax=Methylococcus sp. EFPC2 TaxID=2812648 RepID=UPI0019689446|nr:hypothetical protein [Methylococcus sp. EFPC2]QSA96959.1 hypothetical protein JWZ97_17420 [Methylococcus sp. EFPC2]
MLFGALGAFTVVALAGVLLALDVFKGIGSSKQFALAHAGVALLGSLLVILAALGGDNRVWTNIGLAVVIIGLGITISFKRAKGEHPKGLVAAHGGLAVICYLILAYYTFTPAA